MLRRQVKVAFFRKKTDFVYLYKKVMRILYIITALDYVVAFKFGVYCVEHPLFVSRPERRDKLALCSVARQSVNYDIRGQYAYTFFQSLYVLLHARQAEFTRGVIFFKVCAGEHMQQLELDAVYPAVRRVSTVFSIICSLSPGRKSMTCATVSRPARRSLLTASSKTGRG